MVDVFVIGRLAADAEVKDGKNGKFLSFRMAVDDYDYSNGEKTTAWFSVTCPNERAIRIKDYLTKGKMVKVNGSEHVRTYPAKDGSTQIGRDIAAYNIDFVSAGGGQQDGKSDTTDTSKLVDTGKLAKTETPPPTVVATKYSDTKDDLPF